MATFSALLDLCAGNSPVTGEFPAQRPVMQSFDVFFYLRLNKRLSKQSRHWWVETPSRSLWLHFNVQIYLRNLGLICDGVTFILHSICWCQWRSSDSNPTCMWQSDQFPCTHLKQSLYGQGCCWVRGSGQRRPLWADSTMTSRLRERKPVDKTSKTIIDFADKNLMGLLVTKIREY